MLIYELDGEVKKIVQNSKELEFQKWKEKLCEPIKVMDVKDLETFQPDAYRKPAKRHPWRQGNFLKKAAAGST